MLMFSRRSRQRKRDWRWLGDGAAFKALYVEPGKSPKDPILARGIYYADERSCEDGVAMRIKFRVSRRWWWLVRRSAVRLLRVRWECYDMQSA
jgi:hypothetical protein